MGKIYEIVAVFDNLSESFLQPTFVETMAEAQRIFEYQINNIGLWYDNASDFELYTLGQYNSETGEIISDIHKMIKGSAVRKEKKQRDLRSVEKTEE